MKKVPYSNLTSYFVDRHDRRATDLRKIGVAECIVLGRATYRHAYPPLQSHSHFGIAELAFVESGHQPYEINGQEFTLFGGEGTIIPPDTTHSSSGHPSYPCNKFWLQLLLPKWNEEHNWLGLAKDEAKPLIAMLRQPANLYAKWPRETAARFARLFEIVDRPTTPIQGAMLRNGILQILFDLFDSNIPEIPPASQLRVRKTIMWLESQTELTHSLTQLAVQSGLSLSNFKRVFREVTGITAHHYILHKKIALARSLLLAGNSSIIEIAHQCNFTTSQYFATVFKRMTGVTPSQFICQRGIKPPATNDGQ